MPEADRDYWSVLTERVQESVKAHSPRGDGARYNGGTLFVLAATSGAAFLGPVELGAQGWVPPLLSGLAAFAVGAERALSFGPRWRYHLEMEARYKHVLDQIDFLNLTGDALPEDERKRYYSEIMSDLHELRRREGMIPGAGGAAEGAP